MKHLVITIMLLLTVDLLGQVRHLEDLPRDILEQLDKMGYHQYCKLKSEVMKDLEWFKKEVAPLLVDYEIEYRYYNQGDFGSLNQIVFESLKNGGQIDFWGSDWLGIFLYDYEEKELYLENLQELLLSD